MEKEFDDFVKWLSRNERYEEARQGIRGDMIADYRAGKLNNLEFVTKWADQTAMLHLDAYHNWLHS